WFPDEECIREPDCALEAHLPVFARLVAALDCGLCSPSPQRHARFTRAGKAIARRRVARVFLESRDRCVRRIHGSPGESGHRAIERSHSHSHRSASQHRPSVLRQNELSVPAVTVSNPKFLTTVGATGALTRRARLEQPRFSIRHLVAHSKFQIPNSKFL